MPTAIRHRSDNALLGVTLRRIAQYVAGVQRMIHHVASHPRSPVDSIVG
jgi:hypothetical protein